jgi:hypothetical protein
VRHGGRSETRGRPRSGWQSTSLRYPRRETNREARRVRGRLRSACVHCRRAPRSACVRNAEHAGNRSRRRWQARMVQSGQVTEGLARRTAMVSPEHVAAVDLHTPLSVVAVGLPRCTARVRGSRPRWRGGRGLLRNFTGACSTPHAAGSTPASR